MSDGVHDPGDPLMVTWVLAWVAHQLPIRAGSHLRRQHLLSRAQHARLFRDAAGAGTAGRAAALARRRPILVYNLVFLSGSRCPASASRCSSAASPATPAPPSSPESCSRFALSHRSLRAPAAAADAVHSARVVGVPSAARHQPAARRRAARRLRRRPDAVVHVLRHLPDAVHGHRLRHAADRSALDAVANGWRALAAAAAIVTVVMLPVGRAYLAARKVVGERGRGEVAQNSATLAQLPGAAGSQRRLRQRVRAVHGSRAAAVSGISSRSRWRSSGCGREA